MLTRRKFIQSFAGAVASVAIGMKLSQGMPDIDRIVIRDPHNDPDVKFKATERMLEPKIDWRAFYGTEIIHDPKPFIVTTA